MKRRPRKLFWSGLGSVARYTNDGKGVVEIKEDGTFTANITPAGGANNLAKASTWTGTVVRKGDPGSSSGARKGRG